MLYHDTWNKNLTLILPLLPPLAPLHPALLSDHRYAKAWQLCITCKLWSLYPDSSLLTSPFNAYLPFSPMLNHHLLKGASSDIAE